MSKRLALLGLVSTAVWLLVAAGYVQFGSGWEKLWSSQPDAFGNFVAGVAAPLAFFWLVLGYFQQGEELRLQRAQLELQREELVLQREEMHRLADEAGRQAAAVSANEMHARRDTFLRVAELLLGRLNSIAAEWVLPITSHNHLHNLWNQYGYGNKNAFFDILVGGRVNFKTLLRNQLSDANSKQIMIEFAHTFESLVEQASRCDPDGSLLATFEASRMAEAYIIVCEILELPTQFVARLK